MFRNIMFICIMSFIISGCSSKDLKATGGGISNNPLGLVIGLPIYGIGVLVEKQENEDKKLKEQEEIKKSKVDSEIPLVEDNIKTEEVKQN